MKIPVLVMAGFLYLAGLHRVSCACEETYAKFAGYVPKVQTAQSVLYSSATGNSITAECYNRCKRVGNCAGFILHYAQVKCYQVTMEAFYAAGNDLTPDPGVSFFQRVCLPVPTNCSRAWVTDVVPGYELVGLQDSVIANVGDRLSCSTKCLETIASPNASSALPCLSANYNSWSKTCTLSFRDRETDADAFIPTTKSNTDYIENHCLREEGSICWRDPIQNMSSIRIDTVHSSMSQDACRLRCESNPYYKCLAFSFLPNGGNNGQSVCLLHSDRALLSVGPILTPQLTPTRGAVYVERVSCVNLTVSCDPNILRVTLYSKKFQGYLYVENHYDNCGIEGTGQDVTVLNIPASPEAADACGVRHAFSLTRSVNRTLLSAVVIVQHHKLIQTVQDRVIRVSCYLTDSSEGRPSTPSEPGSSNNVTVGTQVTVADPPAQNEIISGGKNGTEPQGNSTNPGGNPKATMTIVNLETGKPVQKIDVGDMLQLRITVDSPYNVSMVQAAHLIATSGSTSSSILLLDWRGCPPDIPVFPNLLPKDSQTLTANFKAFKFPGSDVLMLSIVLTFCPSACQPSDCGNGVISYGRKKRSTMVRDDYVGTVSPKYITRKAIWSNVGPPESTRNSSGFEEMSLQVALVVTGNSNNNNIIESAPLSPSSIIDSNHSGDDTSNCISLLTLALLGLFWLLVQCVIMTIFCWYLGKREKEHADTISLRRDFHPPPTHHVTWADQQQDGKDSSSAARLRLSTPA